MHRAGVNLRLGLPHLAWLGLIRRHDARQLFLPRMLLLALLAPPAVPSSVRANKHWAAPPVWANAVTVHYFDAVGGS